MNPIGSEIAKRESDQYSERIKKLYEKSKLTRRSSLRSWIYSFYSPELFNEEIYQFIKTKKYTKVDIPYGIFIINDEESDLAFLERNNLLYRIIEENIDYYYENWKNKTKPYWREF